MYEPCPICGCKDHTLNACPLKPVPCLELVVGKLEASHIEPESSTNDDWATILPKCRGKPRNVVKAPKAKSHFSPYPFSARHYPTPMDFKPSSPASPAVGAASSVLFAPTVNRFEPLSEVQVSA